MRPTFANKAEHINNFVAYFTRYGPLTVFEIYNFQTTMDGETIKTNVLDFEKLKNFFIWIRLGFQLILKSDENKMKRTSIPYGHKCNMDGMIGGRK